MKVETKYNVGQEVYYLQEGIIQKSKVTSIVINIQETIFVILYELNYCTKMKEEHLFASANALCENLKIKSGF